MAHRIFFSWQNDRPTGVCRNLIRRALDSAVAEVAKDTAVDAAIRDLAVDSDSAGVPGSPPIVETIFAKIDDAAAFVSDLSYVAARADGRMMPNPNVLLEHGWALKALSWRRVIGVMNTAYGHPEEHPLPFDLQHFRRPIAYHLPDGADPEAKAAARDALAKQFASALRAILQDSMLRPRPTRARKADKHGPRLVSLLQELASDQLRGENPAIVWKPRLFVRLVPEAALAEPRLDPRLVEAAMSLFPPDIEARSESGANARQWWSHDPPRDTGRTNPEALWMTRLVRPGMIEHVAALGKMPHSGPAILVDGRELERLVVHSVRRLGEALARLGLGGPAVLAIGIEGAHSLLLTRARPGGTRIAVPDVLPPPVRLDDPCAHIANRLHEMFDRLWLASGWTDGSPSFANGSWDGN